jgi:hypothetical protein
LLSVWNFWIRRGNAPSDVSPLWESCRKFMCGDACGLRLRWASSANILRFVRRQAYQAFFIRAFPFALRASPQPKIPLLPIDFREIHGRPIMRTAHFRHHVRLIPVSVARNKVSTSDVVVDETIGHCTGIRARLPSVTTAIQGTLMMPHLHVVLVTKSAKFSARLSGRHGPSSRTCVQAGLRSDTMCPRNALLPSDLQFGPRLCAFLRQRRSDVKSLLHENMENGYSRVGFKFFSSHVESVTCAN